MESIFEILFPDVDFKVEGETQVCCPFPHHTYEGTEYYEENPSAGINIDKGLFNCFTCKRGFNEIGFISEFFQIPYNDANKLRKVLLSTKETRMNWELPIKTRQSNRRLIDYMKSDLHYSDEAIEILEIGDVGNNKISYPVFLFDKLVDVVTYRPDQHPKVKRRTGSTSGMIIPYNHWRESTKPTLICAGEKDLASALSIGINAISITGGEGVIPELFAGDFKDRTVFICFDNDDAGRAGAKRLAVFLKPLVSKLKILDISSVCTEKGEDLWDFLHKYGKTRADLSKIIKETPEFNEEDYKKEKEKLVPTVSLMEGSSPKYIGKLVRSNVQTISTFEPPFQVVSSMTGIKSKKVHSDDEKATMDPGEIRTWTLGAETISDMLYLMDSKLTETKIRENKRELLRIPKKEKHVFINDETKETVHKCSITDVFGATDKAQQPLEYIAYSLNKKLETGKQYTITYKLVPHPYDGQKLILLIVDVEDNSEQLSNFKVDENKKALLQLFQPETNVRTTIEEHIERVRGLIGADYIGVLLKIIDLWFHTPLKFNVGTIEVRGYLDTLVVAESRVGKSSTVDVLQKVYNAGSIISLAGSNATVAGLIGGSNKAPGGGYQTRAGVLPQNHGQAVILEELGKANNAVLKEITDMRSSNEVRISRVSGVLRLPAYVRMLALTNTKTRGSNPTPISSYPHGIDVVTDIVGTAEDIARYDMIGVLGETGVKTIDPFWKPKFQPFDEEAYRTRIRWVWSRRPDQVIIDESMYRYLIDKANKVNETYDSYIKIFGTEAWKKIARLAVAVAGYTVSTDETFENIILKPEHVDYAVEFLVSLYDNPTFRFKQYVEEERKYRECGEEGIQLLQDLYKRNPTILMHLEGHATTSRNNMSVISGMITQEFSEYMRALVAGRFVKFHGHDILPTERFRRGMTQIDRRVVVQKLGVDESEFTVKLDKRTDDKK